MVTAEVATQQAIMFSRVLPQQDGVNGRVIEPATGAHREAILVRADRLADAAYKALRVLLQPGGATFVENWLNSQDPGMAQADAIPEPERAYVMAHASELFMEPTLQEEVDALDPIENPGYQSHERVALTPGISMTVEAGCAIPGRKGTTPSLDRKPTNAHAKVVIHFKDTDKTIQIEDEKLPDGTHETAMRFLPQSEDSIPLGGTMYFKDGKITKTGDTVTFE